MPWLVLPAPALGNLLLAGTAIVVALVAGALRYAPVPNAAFALVGGLIVVAVGAVLAKLGLTATPAMVAVIGLAAIISWHIRRYDVTQLRVHRAAADLADRDDTISLLINDLHGRSGDWLWDTGAEGRIRGASEHFANATGFTRSELNGLSFHALAAPEGAALKPQIEKRATFRGIDVCVRAGSELRYWRISGRPVYDADHVFLGFRGVSSDMTDAVVNTDRLSYLAHHDSLTGLWNRARFLEAIDEAIAGVAKGGMATLFLLDLDEFKGINNSLDHPIGDELLAAMPIVSTNVSVPTTSCSALVATNSPCSAAAQSNPLVPLKWQANFYLRSPNHLGWKASHLP